MVRLLLVLLLLATPAHARSCNNGNDPLMGPCNPPDSPPDSPPSPPITRNAPEMENLGALALMVGVGKLVMVIRKRYKERDGA